MEKLVSRKAHNLEVVSSSLAPAQRREKMNNFNNIEQLEQEEETLPTGCTLI